MSKVQILVTTMHQKDISKYAEMNLQTDAVLANQADRDDVQQIKVGASLVQFVTTQTRGVSKNRNIAMEHIGSAVEYVIFADDDIRMHDDYEQTILNEFSNHPEADAIKFNLHSVSERKITMDRIKDYHKASRREVGSWGVWALVMKAKLLRNSSLRFNERFGPGTENYCGEDTVFLQELFKRRVKLYCSPVEIADIDQTNSCWFEGYTKRYLNVTGMVLQETYPLLCYLLVFRSAWRLRKRNAVEFTFGEVLRCYFNGVVKNRRERKQSSAGCGVK